MASLVMIAPKSAQPRSTDPEIDRNNIPALHVLRLSLNKNSEEHS